LQPGFGALVSQNAPAFHSILADGDYEVISAMLRDYEHNDFRYVVGTANSIFPAGALLGWGATPVGASFQTALSAGAVAVDTPSLMLYTWSQANIANRGMSSNQTIPASYSNHVVVLTKDVDMYEQDVSDVDHIVSVFWRATFKPNGIIQDVDSYNNQPWPLADGDVSRISIVPGK